MRDVPDHKFCFVNIQEYEDKSILSRVEYFGMFVQIFMGIVRYLADLASAVLLISFSKYETTQTEIGQSTVFDSWFVRWIKGNGKYLYLVSIVFNYILLAFDMKKAMLIVQSTDISFAYTNEIAFNFYSARDYCYFCFFQQVQATFKISDMLVQFVYFRLQFWKRFLFSDTPRNIVNFVLLMYMVNVTYNKSSSLSSWIKDFNTNKQINIQFTTMVIVFVIYLVDLIRMIIAWVLYVPLVTYIRANIKEFICHKIDKRIGELLKTKAQLRIQNQQHLVKHLYQPKIPIL